MAIRVIDDSKLQSIAVAIQGKDGGGQMTVDEMAGRIEAIPTGSDFDMTVTDNQVKMVIEVNDFDLGFWTRFGISGGGTVTVDWGDGIVESYTGNTSLDYAPQRKHNYQEAGQYLIVETIENGTLTIGSVNGYSTLSEGKVINNYNMADRLRRTYNSKVKELSYGDNVIIQNGFRNIPAIKLYNFIGDPVYLNYTTSDVIKIKDGVTAIPEFGLNETIAFVVKFPASISQIGAYAFADSEICVFDFTEAYLNENNELSITVAATNTFRSVSSSSILLFPTQEIAEVAKVTTNLSQLASQIKYVGEV